MISRRNLLKATPALAIPASGLLTVKRARRDTARASKTVDTGIIKLKLCSGYDAADNNGRVQHYAHVWILPPGVWETLPESKQSPPNDDYEPDGTDWSAQLLDDGRVVAVRLEVKDCFERNATHATTRTRKPWRRCAAPRSSVRFPGVARLGRMAGDDQWRQRPLQVRGQSCWS